MRQPERLENRTVGRHDAPRRDREREADLALEFERVRDAGAAAIAVRPEVERASDAETQERFAGTAWLECDSWYRDEGGRIVANWPGYMREYAARTERLDPADFELIGADPT